MRRGGLLLLHASPALFVSRGRRHLTSFRPHSEEAEANDDVQPTSSSSTVLSDHVIAIAFGAATLSTRHQYQFNRLEHLLQGAMRRAPLQPQCATHTSREGHTFALPTSSTRAAKSGPECGSVEDVLVACSVACTTEDDSVCGTVMPAASASHDGPQGVSSLPFSDETACSTLSYLSSPLESAPSITVYMTGVNHAFHRRVNPRGGPLKGILKGCAEQNALGSVAARGLPYTAISDVYLLSSTTLASGEGQRDTVANGSMCCSAGHHTTSTGSLFPCDQCWRHLLHVGQLRAESQLPPVCLFVCIRDEHVLDEVAAVAQHRMERWGGGCRRLIEVTLVTA